MPSLKEFRNRIRSVKSTQKITSAMKMVAVAKLKRAQDRVHAARPFALGLGQMVERLLSIGVAEDLPVSGNHLHQGRLLILVTSDRGLCGSFNGGLVREARQLLKTWREEETPFAIACIGRRGRDLLKREFQGQIVFDVSDISRNIISWERTQEISRELQSVIARLGFSQIDAIYARYFSAMHQRVTHQQLLPYQSLEGDTPGDEVLFDILEPQPGDLFNDLLPQNLTAQLYRIILESTASEHGARMTAMDNATRNASEVIAKLQLKYNRTRQAMITKELIEVISGAEAV